MINAVLFAAIGYLVGNDKARQKVEQMLMSGLKTSVSNFKNKVVDRDEQNADADKSNAPNTEAL